MRASIVVIALLLIALVCVGTESAKLSSNTNAKKCKDCPDNYTPVCGMVGGTKEKPKVTRFGNQCVLQKYACEKGQEVPQLADSACGPTAPERLQ